MKKFFLLVLPVCFLSACNDSGGEENKILYPVSSLELPERWKKVIELADSIREGDLVLRCGNDMTSESLRDFSLQEKLYSHSGIALMHEGRMHIYSNMAGDINPDEIMRRDPVDSFLTPASNVVMGVYRYDFSGEEIEKLRTGILEYYQRGLRFDKNFDLSTDDKMYCAEMIAKAVEKATGSRITFSKSMVNDHLRNKYLKLALQRKVIPSKKAADQREYLAIDNLYINPHCREVKKYIFGAPQKPIKFPTPENYTH
jgi:hypothetical protein